MDNNNCPECGRFMVSLHDGTSGLCRNCLVVVHETDEDLTVPERVCGE